MEDAPRIYETKRPVDFEQYGLTELENKVLSLIALGVSRKDIADELFISLEKMKPLVFNIYQQIGAKKVDEVLQAALRSIKNP